MKSFIQYILIAVSLIAPMVTVAQRVTRNQTNPQTEKTADHKVVIEPSYAWTILEPLGLREPSTIDTLIYDYAQRFVVPDQSLVFASTGNYGAPGTTMVAFNQKDPGDFFFRNALSKWIPMDGNHRFYNTRIPMTLLSYSTGGSRDNAQDRLSATFSGNVNKQLQIGAMLDYIYSKGCYENQAVKNLAWGLSGSYISDHYDFQGFFNHFNSLNKENGGITDDLYITDPAQLQGGNSTISPKSIPVTLSKAHSRVAGKEFFMNNRYKVGIYQDLEREPGDTIERKRFIPVVSFIWTLDYTGARHIFDDSGTGGANLWSNNYISPSTTHDHTSYWSLRNTFGISLLEGFNKYAKAGLSAFITHEILRYNQTTDTIPNFGEERPSQLTPYPFADKLSPHATENRLWVGGQLTKQQGSWVRYEATGQVALIGRSAGDVRLNGNASLRVPMLKDTLAVTAYGTFSNTEAPYLLENYVSNHFIWHNDFGKTRRFRIGGRLDFNRSYTNLDIGVENIQNLIYFNDASLPTQHGGSIQVFSARLNQNFKVGILHWDNSLIYQTTSNSDVLDLPKFAIYSNLYLQFKVARVLSVQLGVDCNYYTSYYAPDYQPATMSFVNQRTTKIGNYAYMNAYANMRLGKARFFVMCSHVNQGLFDNNYFSMAHYPLNPRLFQMGVSVDFAN